MELESSERGDDTPQRAEIMPHEVHDTVNAYLASKLDRVVFPDRRAECGFHRQMQEHRKRRKTFWRHSHWGRPVMGFDYIPLSAQSAAHHQ